MTKRFGMAVTTFLAGMILALSSAAAQQAPATGTAKTPAASAAPPAAAAAKQTPAPGTAKRAPAAKPGAAATHKAPGTLALKTQKEKASYAVGLNIGKSMQRDGVDVDPNILARGIKDALAGGKTLLTEEEIKSALTTLQGDLRKREQQKMNALGEANQKEGAAFLAANKTKDGVVTLPSGLEYKILKEGTGPKPSAADSVVCNYRGTFLNGTEFDSSYKRGQPATFPVTGVIRGWTEALQLMPVGSKWQLFLPSDLAYGPGGAGPGSGIGPNATLVFEVELVAIQPKEEGKGADKP